LIFGRNLSSLAVARGGGDGAVVLLIGYLTRLERDEWDARVRPLMRIVLDGLRRRL
jgi:hypothetical protein